MWLALSSQTWNDLELGDYADRYLVDAFSSVKNVGRILVGGLRELSIRVWIDPVKLAANDLTVQEVERALRGCLLYTSPSPRDATLSRMPSSA